VAKLDEASAVAGQQASELAAALDAGCAEGVGVRHELCCALGHSEEFRDITLRSSKCDKHTSLLLRIASIVYHNR
jgi:hypothetical protein